MEGKKQKIKMKKSILFLLLVFIFCFPWQIEAQDNFQQNIIIVKARVTEIVSTGTESAGDLNDSRTSPTQDIKVMIEEGKDAGKLVELTNDYVMLNVGDLFYLNETPNPDGTVSYNVNAPYRLNTLFLFFVIFLILVFLFGGAQGMRGLISLGSSLVLIVFVLVPDILHGFSPIIASLGVASLIIVVGSYITHGFNKTTTAAVIGMIITVVVTGAIAYYAISIAHLTGADENAIYLSTNSSINIDLIGLLFGGIMIGLLGVLYDVAISQAISVEELYKVAPHLGKINIYKRAIRIGKEHIGALVGTLAIAYVGVSLPLILLYAKSSTSIFVTLNQEIFSTEVLRILIGSIGLILAVPITTLLSVYIIIKKKEDGFKENIIEEEEENIKYIGHKH